MIIYWLVMTMFSKIKSVLAYLSALLLILILLELGSRLILDLGIDSIPSRETIRQLRSEVAGAGLKEETRQPWPGMKRILPHPLL